MLWRARADEPGCPVARRGQAVVARRGQAVVARRGQAVIEMALLAPILLLLFLMVADFGRVYHDFVAVVSAARAGAAVAADATRSDADAITAATQEAAGSISSLSVSVSSPRSAGGDASVTASATFTPLTPGVRELLGESLTLTSTATVRVY